MSGTQEERARFEAKFPMPEGCVHSESGYMPTSYNAWDALKHIERWAGWQAKAADSAAATQKLIDGLEEIAYGKDQWTAVGMVEIASDVLRDYRSALKGDGGKV